MNIAASKVVENPHCRFCALEYRAQHGSDTPWRPPQVIVLVLRDVTSKLCFLVHPELRKIVQIEDVGYIQSLLRDFLERAKLYPEELFQQTSSLGVGPLVTYVVGQNLQDYPELQEFYTSFVQL